MHGLLHRGLTTWLLKEKPKLLIVDLPSFCVWTCEFLDLLFLPSMHRIRWHQVEARHVFQSVPVCSSVLSHAEAWVHCSNPDSWSKPEFWRLSLLPRAFDAVLLHYSQESEDLGGKLKDRLNDLVILNVSHSSILSIRTCQNWHGRKNMRTMNSTHSFLHGQDSSMFHAETVQIRNMPRQCQDHGFIWIPVLQLCSVNFVLWISTACSTINWHPWCRLVTSRAISYYLGPSHVTSTFLTAIST